MGSGAGGAGDGVIGNDIGAGGKPGGGPAGGPEPGRGEVPGSRYGGHGGQDRTGGLEGRLRTILVRLDRVFLYKQTTGPTASADSIRKC